MPTIPPAPGRLSTMTVCFRRAPRSVLTKRAIVSVGPGGQGTMRRIAFSGYAALACAHGNAGAIESSAAASANFLVMEPPVSGGALPRTLRDDPAAVAHATIVRSGVGCVIT